MAFKTCWSTVAFKNCGNIGDVFKQMFAGAITPFLLLCYKGKICCSFQTGSIFIFCSIHINIIILHDVFHAVPQDWRFPEILLFLISFLFMTGNVTFLGWSECFTSLTLYVLFNANSTFSWCCFWGVYVYIPFSMLLLLLEKIEINVKT